MKNIKKIILLSILILSSSKSGCFLDGISEKAAKALAPSLVEMSTGIGVEAAQALAPAVADAAKALGSDAATALANGNVEVAKILAPAMVDASNGIGSDAAIAIANSNLAIAKEVMPYVGPVMVAATVVAGVGVAAYSVTQLQPVIKDTCEIFYPTDKQIEENTAARERTAFYEARANLRKCFMSSKTEDKRNNAGYPTICEETVKMLTMCGGESEAERMIAGFNKYWN